MPIKVLIDLLSNLDQTKYIYLNYNIDYQDEFVVAECDDENVVLVPKYKLEKLKNSQNFDYCSIHN